MIVDEKSHYAAERKDFKILKRRAARHALSAVSASGTGISGNPVIDGASGALSHPFHMAIRIQHVSAFEMLINVFRRQPVNIGKSGTGADVAGMQIQRGEWASH